jgi:hypothetical protein
MVIYYLPMSKNERGFIGMLDGFWQEILFDDSGLDRAAAAQLCGSYLDLLDSAFRNAKN